MQTQTPRQTPDYIGIDFGTSKSTVAWFDPQAKRARIIRNAEGEEKTPSVVYFGESGLLVGTPAEQMLEYPEERGHVVMSIKRDLAFSPTIALPGRRVKGVDIVAEILRKLKRDTEELHFNAPVKRVVITHPAEFSLIEQDKIEEAALLAGFIEVSLLEEPVAAALAYAQAGLNIGRYLLVYDLGGGTFDLAVLERDEAGGGFRVALKPKGLARCGGDDFDRALYDYCDNIALQQLGRSISLSSILDPYFLRLCRLRKENLSLQERVTFSSLLASEEGSRSVRLQQAIERATLEDLIGDRVGVTMRLTRAMLQEAASEGKPVDTVVMIGGSSRIPMVQRLLGETLPVEPRRWAEQDMAVALGAAIRAHELWREPTPDAGPKPPVDVVPPPVEAEGSPKAAPAPDPENRLPTYTEDEGPSISVGVSNAFTLARTLIARRGSPAPVAVSPRGTILAAPHSTDLSGIQLWNIHTGSPVRFLTLPRLSSDSEAGETRDANNTTQTLRSVLGEIGMPPAVRRLTADIAISPDGKYLGASFGNKVVRLWDLTTGAHLYVISRLDSSFISLDFYPDGEVLICSSAYGNLNLYEVRSGQYMHTLRAHKAAITSLAFGPDEQTFATGSVDKTMKIWNLRTGAVRFTLPDHEGLKGASEVLSVAVSPDGQTAVMGRANAPILVWNIHKVKLHATLKGHAGKVNALAISPDGKLLASGGKDQTVRIWDLETGELLRSLLAYAEEVYSLAFSPTGQYLISGGSLGTILVWERQ
jgi:WD40 repeat protein